MKKTRKHKPARKKPAKKKNNHALQAQKEDMNEVNISSPSVAAMPASSAAAPMSAAAPAAPASSLPVASSASSAAPASSLPVAAKSSTAAQVQKVGIFDFIRQVRNEAARVTWPTRSETIVTTIMVFIMVTLAALFFLAADQILSRGVAMILGVFGR